MSPNRRGAGEEDCSSLYVRLLCEIIQLYSSEQLSSQSHYNFGLRALKYVLVSAGNIKREKLASAGSAALEDVAEQQMLLQSVCETLVPKLVSEDRTLLFSLLQYVFPSISYQPNQMLS